MPLGNGFITPDQFDQEYYFGMDVAFCSECGMVQLLEQPDEKQMFHENYAFFSGTSNYMTRHFKAFADHVINDYIESPDPFVVEMGSNDGIMLQNFLNSNIRHLGIEPSKNVAQAAIDKGINTISEFFNKDLALKIVEEYGQADAFLSANVMCHIPYLHSIADGIKSILKPKGVLMFEDPYLGDVIEKTSYDQIYDEHTFLFSATSVSNLFEMHGLELIAVEPQITHGGSMRYVLSHKGARPIDDSVKLQLEKEKTLGLDKAETYEQFRANCEKSAKDLLHLLKKLKSEGKRVVGYGATSKSTTIMNYSGITPDLIEFISDTTPTKQGKLTPGVHIPVHPPEKFRENYPDYAVLFAWNHKKEILENETEFAKSGGKWIVFVPKVEVLP